jgi:hypothetical protein
MGLNHSPRIATDGLILSLDPNNVRSYANNILSNLARSKESILNDEYLSNGEGFEYVSSQNASSLGFSYGPNTVKGESDVIGGVCSGLMTFQQALEFVHAAGARLPSMQEILDGAAAESGCGYDAELIWTCDPVPGSSGTSHYCMYGNVDNYGKARVAKDNSSTAYVRYVADVNVSRSDPILVVNDPFLKNWLTEYNSVSPNSVGNTRKQIIFSLNPESNPQLVNGTTVVDGNFVFDGVNDYINLGKTFVHPGEIELGNSSYSLEAWIFIDESCNPGDLLAGASIIGNNSQYGVGIQILSNNGIRVNFGIRSTNNFNSVSTLDKNRWYHIVGVRNAGAYNRIYINGEPDTDFSSSELTVLSAQNTFMHIGFCSARLSTPFAGKMNGIKIYNKALSDADVKRSFNATRSRFGI